MVFLTGPPPRSDSLKSLDFFWSYFFDPPLLRVVVCSAVFFPLVRQQKGFTPLHEASRYGHVRVVQMLLRFYETPDPEGKVRPGPPLPRSLLIRSPSLSSFVLFFLLSSPPLLFSAFVFSSPHSCVSSLFLSTLPSSSLRFRVVVVAIVFVVLCRCHCRIRSNRPAVVWSSLPLFFAAPVDLLIAICEFAPVSICLFICLFVYSTGSLCLFGCLFRCSPGLADTDDALL